MYANTNSEQLNRQLPWKQSRNLGVLNLLVEFYEAVDEAFYEIGPASEVIVR